VTAIPNARDVIALSLRYDDDVMPGRVLVEAVATEMRAAA
jgi:hypothetical protein